MTLNEITVGISTSLSKIYRGDKQFITETATRVVL